MSRPIRRQPASALAERFCLGGALLAAVALWLPRLSGPIDLRYDAGAYFVLGSALADGRGYRLLNEPGEIEALQYPPLLPLIVATHQRVLGTSDPFLVGCWLRRSFFLLSVCYALAAYLLARTFLAAPASLLASLLGTLCFYTYFLSDLCFAEIPFALTTILFVLASRRAGRLLGVVTPLLGVASFLLRTSGLALLAAWVLESLLARRFAQAARRAAIALCPVLLWQVHVQRVRNGPEYRQPAYAYQRAPYLYYNVSYAENAALIDPFRPERGVASTGDLVRRVAGNLAVLPARLGEAVSAPQGFWESSFHWLHRRLGRAVAPVNARRIMAALGWLIAAAVVWLWARGERLIPLYVTASLGLICLTPWPAQLARYMAPLVPFLTVALVSGLVEWMRWLERAGARARALGSLGAFASLASILVLQAFALGISFVRSHDAVTYDAGHGRAVNGRLFFHDASWTSFEAALAWLRAHARPADVVATSAPHLAFLRTGLRAVMPPFDHEPARAQRLLDSVPVRYLIVDDLGASDLTRRYAAPVVALEPRLWTPVFAGTGGLRVYRRAD